MLLKQILAAISVTLLLTACGGGGSTTQDTPKNDSSVIPPTKVRPPKINYQYALGGPSVYLGGDGGTVAANPSAGGNVEVLGNSNNVFVVSYSRIQNFLVTGNANLFVFGYSVTVSSLTVNGLNNTIWLPEQTKLADTSKIDQTTVIKYYTP